MGAARVVAADALICRPPDEEGRVEEVGMGTVGDVDDGMRAADDVQLLVAPVGTLCALVLRIADRRRLPHQRLSRTRRVEVELDHLPVALVRVPEVVEDVEEPVLQREPTGIPGLGGDVRVHRRLRARRDLALPQLVAAAGAKRIPGKVEVVVEEAATQLGCRRPDRDEVGAAPRPTQSHRVVAENHVDVDRPVRLSRPAHLLLLHQLDGRGKAVRQCPLRVEHGGAGATGSNEADERDGDDVPVH